MSLCASNLRDCQAWKENKLPVSTTSNDAAKMFDSVLRQVVTWTSCESMGGIELCCERLLQADADFVLGRTLVLGLDVIGTGRSPRLDKQFAGQLQILIDDSERLPITPREALHAKAIKLFSDGHMNQACSIWEAILAENPTDMMALKFAHDAYFYLGEKEHIRDSVARVLPKWTRDIPLYSYLKGMVAFGLEECGQYDEAEKQAKEALSMERQDAWATHAVAHCYEMNGRFDEGIHFLQSTNQDWTSCGMLACHNYWHNALYHIEKADYDSALGIFDDEIGKRCSSGMMLDLVDASSLLYRLQLEDVDVESRWESVYKYCQPHWEDHILAFNDAHMLMSIIGKGDEEGKQKHEQSMKDYLLTGSGDSREINAKYGQPICEAMLAFDAQDYAAAVDLLYPIRDDIFHIGGSHAQRDVFDQLLIHSCLKSLNVDHNHLAWELILRRNMLKPNSSLAERLACKFKVLHGAHD